jgi:hypothetical protein
MHLACSALATSADRPITSVVVRGQALATSATRFGDVPAVREFRERMHMIVTASDNRRRGLSHVSTLRSQT